MPSRCTRCNNSKTKEVVRTKMYIPTGITNYKKLRIEDYYTVDTLCTLWAQACAEEAIQQIVENKYDCELSGEIIHIGLAHAGKSVVMEWIEK